MISEHLYFIAIIPPQPIKNDIQQIKETFAHTYNVYHALKSPPHITLIPPFKLSDSDGSKLSEFLNHFARDVEPFNLTIDNYACFKPRVIFLKPILNDALADLYDQSSKRFFEVFPVGKPSKRPFHPHLTIAFRDLKPGTFRKAWLECKNKIFQASFSVDRLFLLKHNGKRWEASEEFSFRNK